MKLFVSSKHQRLHRWSLGMDKSFHPKLHWAYDCLFRLRLRSIHVSKRNPGCLSCFILIELKIRIQKGMSYGGICRSYYLNSLIFSAVSSHHIYVIDFLVSNKSVDGISSHNTTIISRCYQMARQALPCKYFLSEIIFDKMSNPGIMSSLKSLSTKGAHVSLILLTSDFHAHLGPRLRRNNNFQT